MDRERTAERIFGEKLGDGNETEREPRVFRCLETEARERERQCSRPREEYLGSLTQESPIQIIVLGQ